MVEDLMQLQTGLDFVLRNMEEEKSSKVLQLSQDFITKNITEKKTEIKIQILKSQYLMGSKDAEEFRLLCIWDFCPKVKMSKEDYVHQSELPRLRDNKTESSQLLLSLETTKGKYNDDKIRSEEIIMTQPKYTLPFFEEETAVKYEPWEVHDLVDGGDVDSHIKDDYYVQTFTEQSAGDVIVTQSAEPEPSLSILELSVISITTSKNLQRTTKEIYNFITNAFSFYKKGRGRKKCNPKSLQSALRRCNFIKRVKLESLTAINTIVNTVKSFSFIKRLQQKLKDFCFEMYPTFLKQLPFFRNALLKWSTTNDAMANYLTENAGSAYKERIICVETDVNEVKIEHLVYSLESRNEDGESLITKPLQHLTEERTCQENQESILNYKIEPEIISFSAVQESPRTEGKQSHITDEEESDCKVDEAENIKCPFVQKLPSNILIDGNIYPRPGFPYSCLIAMALKNSLNGSLRVTEIYKFIWYHFPYFKTAPSGWKNSVRHNLCVHRCFVKIVRPGTFGKERCLWALNSDPVKIHKMNTEIYKMDRKIQKFSEKDPVAIKRAMFEPENLEKMVKGELKRDFSENDDDKEDAVPPPDPPVKRQAHRSRPNYLASFAGDDFITSTDTAAIVHQNLASLHVTSLHDRSNILEILQVSR